MRSVLLVEDDHDTRVSLREALESDGFQVHSAAHGLEALALLQRGLSPSLMLVDQNLPILDGPEFLKRVSRGDTGRRIPVIVHSAVRLRTDPQLYTRYLPKPVSLETLIQTVRGVLTDSPS